MCGSRSKRYQDEKLILIWREDSFFYSFATGKLQYLPIDPPRGFNWQKKNHIKDTNLSLFTHSSDIINPALWMNQHPQFELYDVDPLTRSSLGTGNIHIKLPYMKFNISSYISYSNNLILKYIITKQSQKNLIFNPDQYILSISQTFINQQLEDIATYSQDEETEYLNIIREFTDSHFQDKPQIPIITYLYIFLKLITNEHDKDIAQTFYHQYVKTNTRLNESHIRALFKAKHINELPTIEEIKRLAFNTKQTLFSDGPNLLNIINNDFTKDIFADLFSMILIESSSNKFSSQLSSGERDSILLLALLDMYFEKNNNKKHIVFLDEIDTFYHPNWAKSLLNVLISHCNDKDMHIIVSSHSPFILSDIPKENVIFLNKFTDDDMEVKAGVQKIGNCKNVSDETNIETFGANIHTLLSHGFFMKDALMGEFAKEKIQSIIKYHEEIKNKDLLKDEHKQLREEEKEEYEKDKKNNFWNIQSIIGDDYLKQVIKNHLVEIEKILYKDMYLDNEIERMKKELKKLEALKNA
jgi:hypothetical protein